MESKNLAPRNIQDKWIRFLSKDYHSISKVKGLIKINFVYKAATYKVLINEEQNWFLLISSQKITTQAGVPEMEDFVMSLSARVPIGYLDYKENSSDKPGDFKLLYKTHQRFIRNDDDYSINRAIEMHLADHRSLFLDILKSVNQSNNTPDLGKLDQGIFDKKYSEY
jgi:hypothetical protein